MKITLGELEKMERTIIKNFQDAGLTGMRNYYAGQLALIKNQIDFAKRQRKGK